MLAPNAHLRALVVPQKPEPPAPPAPAAPVAQLAECEVTCAHHRPVRLSWASLLKRVFAVDLEHCPNCGGELKIIAAILEAPVIEKILMHLVVEARLPGPAPAAGRALGRSLSRPTGAGSPARAGHLRPARRPARPGAQQAGCRRCQSVTCW